MAKTLQKKIKFSKGQVSPELIERTDLSFYDASAQIMKNVISTIYGGVRSRLGTKYIDYITDIDEVEPDSITSDIFNDTSHFTDLTGVTSPTLSTNKLLAEMDYGSNASGSCRIEIKGIKVNPYSVEHSTAGSYTETLESGVYKIKVVGAGGGGAGQTDAPRDYKSCQAGGGSGSVVEGIWNLTADSYAITVGAGGNGAHGSYGTSTASAGGNSTFSDKATAYGGGGGVARWTDGSGGSATAGAGGAMPVVADAESILSQTAGSWGGAHGGAGSAYGGSNGSGYGTGGSAYCSGGTSIGNNGESGYVSVSLYEPSYNLKFYASTDGNTWEEIATRNISTTEYDLSVEMNYRYRYVKIELSGDESLQSTLSFQYIRNDISGSSQSELPVKMHRFIYNNEDKYLLVFVEEKVQIFKDDTLVQIVTASGLLQNYVREIDVAYKDDTVIITHPQMPPKQLQRQSDGTWVWSDFTIKNTPYYLFGSETTAAKTVGITPSGLEGSIKITADSSVFDSSWVGQFIDGNGGRVRITEYTSGTVVKGVTVIPFYTTDKITSWDYISGYEAVWSAQRGYPSTCLFAQQRLWFGGSYSLPSHIWASRLDDYNNFKNAGNYDNDAIDVTMLTNNRIMNMVEQRGIHVLTSGDEWTIKEGTYTPNLISITKNTANGSYGIEPAIISGNVCFIEKNGKSLLSYAYDYDQASFTTENISLFSSLIEKPVAFDVEINSSRDKSDFIYLVLADGTMLCGCLLLDQKIISISQYKTDGDIKDVCCLLDSVYMLVDRNGTICLEKITDTRTDCTRQEYITTSQVDGLYRYNNKYVYVYTDTKNFGKYLVENNTIFLEEVPNETCNIGIAYDYYLESNPIAINGKTTSIKKRISKATLTCKDTERLEFNGQKKKSNSDIFDFYSCTKYENDVRFNIRGEYYPIDILSVLLNINYEG